MLDKNFLWQNFKQVENITWIDTRNVLKIYFCEISVLAPGCLSMDFMHVTSLSRAGGILFTVPQECQRAQPPITPTDDF